MPDIHALVLLYQLAAMNAAINSAGHGLITLLISNQFVEIKSSVFKKFEKETLFQTMCTDVLKRMHLVLMLLIVFAKNAMSSSPSALIEDLGTVHFIRNLWRTAAPCVAVYFCEVMVDWLKYCFVAKLNRMTPEIFLQLRGTVLCELHRVAAPSERSNRCSLRIGYSCMPMVCVVVHLFMSDVARLGARGAAVLVAAMVVFKTGLAVLLGEPRGEAKRAED